MDRKGGVSIPTMIGQGSRGADVAEAQRILAARGWALGIDGDFGPLTLGAVIEFQASEGLKADGVIGSRTWARLQEPAGVVLNVGPDDRFQPTAMARGGAAAALAKVASYRGDPDAEPSDPAQAIQWRFLVEMAHRAALGHAEEPDGSNTGPDLADLYELRSSRKPIPWCALACSWGIRAAGWHDFPVFVGSWQFEKWARAHGAWLSPTSTIWAGDVFVMGRHGSGSDIAEGAPDDARRYPYPGHSGAASTETGGRLWGVGGNVSNRFKAQAIDVSQLRGVVRWGPLAIKALS